ncbi:PREDICTED: G/T mismatch-specific thymine DNA glycosylase-like [Ceratosolen solmsi marchali]|uniref:G/T mismatch-specific thymine DNA glycosylase n=1 Tax=Ceratosolen solmsi marchali TaxID=326594 RepID=A0AAJ6YLR9_9HYME|nr:PREDICTED: G/T mismatch-specific thymine DNA glycosylase-like [Ceratosolen solmsi marchali]
MSLSLQNLTKRAVPVGIEKATKKINRFDGLSEEEVKKNTLKDILEVDLDLVFVGINPSLMAAHTGRYYAGPGNHFYKLLFESKLIPKAVTYEEDYKLLQYKIGLTNIVARATRSSADLSKSEIRKGAILVQEKLKHFRPKIAIFNGKCIYEEFVDKFDKSSFCFGLQPNRVGDTALWVVPSSSARCANFPRMQDKLHFYTSLKKYLAFLKGEIDEVNLNEFHFEGTCKQAVARTSIMWRRKVKQIENNETEKDSGISMSQSDYSQELSEDNYAQTLNNKPKQQNSLRRTKRQSRKAIKQSTAIALRSSKDKSQNIDFINLIKERLNNKNRNTSKCEKNDCN